MYYYLKLTINIREKNEKNYIIASSIMLLVFANVNAAEKRIGSIWCFTQFSSDGTETMKSSGTKTSKTHDETVVVPSIFIEVANDNGFSDWIRFYAN